MNRKTTGPMRAELRRDSAAWGKYIVALCDDVEMLVGENAQLRMVYDSGRTYQRVRREQPEVAARAFADVVHAVDAYAAWCEKQEKRAAKTAVPENPRSD